VIDNLIAVLQGRADAMENEVFEIQRTVWTENAALPRDRYKADVISIAAEFLVAEYRELADDLKRSMNEEGR
jgi:hypothetical protein